MTLIMQICMHVYVCVCTCVCMCTYAYVYYDFCILIALLHSPLIGCITYKHAGVMEHET